MDEPEFREIATKASSSAPKLRAAAAGSSANAAKYHTRISATKY